MTGQPDFARLRITYIPDQLCVESKSLKLYLWSYRDRGAFHEAVTNQILDDLVAALAPRWIRVEGDFLIRGGIRTLVAADTAVRDEVGIARAGGAGLQPGRPPGQPRRRPGRPGRPGRGDPLAAVARRPPTNPAGVPTT